MFGPERAGQMVFDTPLLGKGAWGGLRSYVCLTQTASILCKLHILSNRCLRICCRRFGERYRSGRKGKKSPPHYAPGRGLSLLFLSVLADGSALQPAEGDPPHNMALQCEEEDDDRNDSQCRAGHLQLILVAFLHPQVGDRYRQLLL